MDAGRSYHLVVQPTSGAPSYQQRYEAENASVFRARRFTSSGASNGYYVGLIDNSGDFRNDSYVDFIVNVPTDRAYTMTIRYANGTGSTSTHGLAYNGGPWSTVSYPPTGGWGWANAFATVGEPARGAQRDPPRQGLALLRRRRRLRGTRLHPARLIRRPHRGVTTSCRNAPKHLH